MDIDDALGGSDSYTGHEDSGAVDIDAALNDDPQNSFQVIFVFVFIEVSMILEVENKYVMLETETCFYKLKGHTIFT